jgi:hypothetical protein
VPREDDTGRTGIDQLGHTVVLTQFEHIACSNYVGVIELAILSPHPHFGGDVEYNLTTLDGSREAIEIAEVAAKTLDAQRFEVGISSSLKRANVIPPLMKPLNDGASKKTAAARDQNLH